MQHHGFIGDCDGLNMTLGYVVVQYLVKVCWYSQMVRCVQVLNVLPQLLCKYCVLSELCDVVLRC